MKSLSLSLAGTKVNFFYTRFFNKALQNRKVVWVFHFTLNKAQLWSRGAFCLRMCKGNCCHLETALMSLLHTNKMAGIAGITVLISRSLFSLFIYSLFYNGQKEGCAICGRQYTNVSFPKRRSVSRRLRVVF